MADLPHELDRAIVCARNAGNFLLRLNDLEMTPARIANGLILSLLVGAERIVLPGFNRTWLRAAENPPAWALFLDAHVQAEPGIAHLPAIHATAPSLRPFWLQGDFVERPAHAAPRVHRPGWPVLVLHPSRLASTSFHHYATGFVGTVAGGDRVRGLYRKALEYAWSDARAHPELVHVMFQAPSWLMFLGSGDALASSLQQISDNLRNPPRQSKP